MSAPLCGLPRAAALGRLAQIFYYARGEFFDLDVPHWEALSAYEQHIHVAYVMTCLEGLPAAVMSIHESRRPDGDQTNGDVSNVAATVNGRPKNPNDLGEGASVNASLVAEAGSEPADSHRQADYFAVAADLSRAAGAKLLAFRGGDQTPMPGDVRD